MSKLRSYSDTVFVSKDCIRCNINCITEVLSFDKVEKNKRVVNELTYKTDDSLHRYDGMKVSDFYLENMQDAGVSLNPAFSQLNSFQNYDIIDNTIYQIVQNTKKN